MDTVRELRHLIEDLTEDLESQYGDERGWAEVLHLELGLPQTRRDDADKIIEKLKAKEVDPSDVFGDDYETTSLRLTKEHEDLHKALRRVILNTVSVNADMNQMASQMLAVGRRMGLREAAEMMGEQS